MLILREVVEFYTDGSIERGSSSFNIERLNLNDQETDDLVAFLESLTIDDQSVALPVTPFNLSKTRNNILTIKFLSVTALSAALLGNDDIIVDQNNLQFSVTELSVTKGSAISFTNGNRTPQNLMVKNGGMMVNSGAQRPGHAREILFDKSGEFNLICGTHPKMKMTVNVE